MNLYDILAKLKANSRVVVPGAVIFAAGIVLRFPSLISWVPEPVHGAMLQTASEIVQWAWVGILAPFLKANNVSGIGTAQNPLVKPDAGQSKPV